jgi:hypothetical protein
LNTLFQFLRFLGRGGGVSAGDHNLCQDWLLRDLGFPMLEFQLRLEDIIAESQAFQLALLDLDLVAQFVDLSAKFI